MIFVELQNALLDDGEWLCGVVSSIENFLSWTAVPQVCSSWRGAALGHVPLWTTIVSVSEKVFGLAMIEDDDSEMGMKPIWPTSTRPLRVFLGPTGPNEFLLKTLLPKVSRIQDVFIAINDEQSRKKRNRLTRAVAPYLRTLVIADSGEHPNKMHTLKGDFRSLEILTLRGYSSFKPLRFDHLRTLNIAKAVFFQPKSLDRFATLVQAVITLNDVSFQDVEIFPETNDIINNNRLRGSNLRRITCTHTTGVAALLQCFGIPANVVLVMKDIVVDNILPDDVDVLGDFVDIEMADVYIGNGQLRVVIHQGGSVLRAEWDLGTYDWVRTFTGLLNSARVLRVHVTGGGDTWKEMGDGDEQPLPEDIERLILQLARQSGVPVLQDKSVG